jgi:hypothetical protein
VNLRIQLSALVFCFLFAVSVKPFQPAAPLWLTRQFCSTSLEASSYFNMHLLCRTGFPSGKGPFISIPARPTSGPSISWPEKMTRFRAVRMAYIERDLRLSQQWGWWCTSGFWRRVESSVEGFGPEDGNSMFLRNVIYSQVDMAPKPSTSHWLLLSWEFLSVYGMDREVFRLNEGGISRQ